MEEELEAAHIITEESAAGAHYVIPFSEFRSLGEIGRLGQSDPAEAESSHSLGNLVIDAGSRVVPAVDLLVDINALSPLSSIVIFVSHRWLSATEATNGFRGRPHPDDAGNHTFTLICQAVATIASQFPTLAPHLWIDFTCLNQDHHPAAKMMDLDELMKHVDVMLTPIVDDTANSWELVATEKGNFEDYRAPAFRGTETSYLSRAWCRTEMMYCARIPMAAAAVTEERLGLLTRGAIKLGLSNLRRPHLIYGSRENLLGSSPIVMPPLQQWFVLNAFFTRYNPLDGTMSMDGDRDTIAELVNAVRRVPHDKVAIGWSGIRDETGKPTGDGVFTYIYGDVYRGPFDHGVRHGVGELDYANGDEYRGDFVNGVRCGHGILRSADGSEYDGEWINDEMTGRGTYRNSEGDIVDCPRENGVRVGRGTVRYADGSVFTGEFANDKMNGRGSLVLANGDSVEGEWVDGQRCGRCIERTANGDVYDGNFENNIRSGAGVLTYANGAVYEGNFDNNMKNGIGTLKYASGDMYNGSFVNDEIKGPGIFESTNGDLYSGYWKDGLKHGKGSQVWANGDVYDGDWENGVRTGLGQVNFYSGQVYAGGWKDDKMSGHGVYKWPDGIEYDGNWENNQRNGYGVISLPKGDVYESNWKDDVKSGIGTLRSHTGQVYSGLFANGIQSGAGTLTYPNGRVSDCIFQGVDKDGNAKLVSEVMRSRFAVKIR